jgi:predicted nucleic acid-binding protein
VIVLDTSGLLAAIDSSQRHHVAARRVLESGGSRILSLFVLAELDYLIATRIGAAAERALLDEVARGAYRLEPFSSDDVRVARNVLERYADQSLGLADASIIVLAHRYGTRDLLTLDERHFRTVLGLDDSPFRLLPQDLDS